jgi:hypothetical protein
VSKRRAAAIVIGGILITMPAQFAFGLAGLTHAFAGDDARYAMEAGSWVGYLAVASGVGFGLATGLCLVLTRRLSSQARHRVLVRFLESLAVIAVLAGLGDLGHAEYDAEGRLVSTGITPFMLFTWLAGGAIAVRLMRRVAQEPLPVMPPA